MRFNSKKKSRTRQKKTIVRLASKRLHKGGAKNKTTENTFRGKINKY